ncbi:MAG: glycosyltransferase, partial [Bacteroidota bacterium]
PVIASDINGCNEIVEEGSTGWLVPARDADGLARRMITVLADRKALQEKGSAGRLRVVERYDRMEVWRLLEAEYRRAVGGGPAA